ncbi:nucleopolyhedrovirus P10 family protein [Streptomyces sp. DSM 15324]|uniref:nucleopolyhedrovirus P10 family protein n=1 Tax=Streptomyces sp. DSM 15324 TaxID=1739111 RepID=UPI000749EE63|nr:nucleopolyhedrovirus P10 family protein [Streptomyces sp. DSM 15324]KUO07115.1 nucleopolyhedrovirus P10 family protein [Streptomyces sp. DSM 15324]
MDGSTSATSAVRQRLGLGRLVPLGGPRDGAWITEEAANGVLRAAVREVPGVRLGVLRLAPADPDDAAEPVVPPPPSGLPPGALRVTADFAASPAWPLPATAGRVREALATAAGRLGLTVTEVDLRVTDLLDGDEPAPRPAAPPAAAPTGPPLTGGEALAGEAALSVPGVTGLTGALGRAVRLESVASPGAVALPHRHARVEITVGADHRAVDVARQVRAAVSQALPDHPTVTVLVTGVG